MQVAVCMARFVCVPCHAGKVSQNASESISERLKFKNFLGGTPLASFARTQILGGTGLTNLYELPLAMDDTPVFTVGY